MPALDAAVPHLFALAGGLLPVLSLWFAGSARRLANVDYDRVTDPAALNRWAARRFLLLPAISLLNAALSLTGRVSDTLLWVAWTVTILVVTTWLAIGARRWQTHAPRPH